MKSLSQENDPTGRSAHDPGSKLDAGKPCLFRGVIDYFPRAIEAVGAVSTFGAQKYVWKGWESVPDGVARYSDAMVRHLAKEGKGEVLDPDSGLYHAAHTAWGALARLELMLREKEDDRAEQVRPETEKVDPEEESSRKGLTHPEVSAADNFFAKGQRK